jgi:hypothetical protein
LAPTSLADGLPSVGVVERERPGASLRADTDVAASGVGAAPSDAETLTRWHANERGSWRYVVMLDGVKVERAWSADVEAGEVVVTLVNARGIAYGCLDGQEHRRETRAGKVEIRRR